MKAHAFNHRPVWKMADKMTGGQLQNIIRYERARGQSYDSIARFLSNQYGVDITKITIAKWCKEIAEADARGETL